MNHIQYDFVEFINIFDEMLTKGSVSPANLRNIKNELNRFFKDSTCKEVLYTNNTDKMFFGMKIIAVIDADEIYEYLVDDEKIRIGKYIVEIDSHLLNPALNLLPEELLAILLHEVGHLVGDTTPIEDARNAINAYLAANRDHIDIHQSVHYKELLAYGLKDYLSKNTSLFYIGDESEVYADEFAESYGFLEHLIKAYEKVAKNNFKLYENSEVSKFIVFSLILSLYKNIKLHRIGAIRTLNRAKILTGSRLEQIEIDNVIRRLSRIDDSMIHEGSLSVKISGHLRKSRMNNLRMIDGTFYEISMQVKNVEDEDDALYLMRKINTNISIIEEYRYMKDMHEDEIEKWNEKSKEGLLHNDADISSFLRDMRSALYSVYGEDMLANFGIDTSTDYKDYGKLSIDSTKLKSAIETDAESIRKLFVGEDGLGARLNEICNNTASTSSGSPGSLVQLAGVEGKATEKNNTLTKRLDSIEERIEVLKALYETRKERYWNQFNAMETALANINSTSMYLSGMISG